GTRSPHLLEPALELQEDAEALLLEPIEPKVLIEGWSEIDIAAGGKQAPVARAGTDLPVRRDGVVDEQLRRHAIGGRARDDVRSPPELVRALAQQMAVLVLEPGIGGGSDPPRDRRVSVNDEPALDADAHRVPGRLVAHDRHVERNGHAARTDADTQDPEIRLIALDAVSRELFLPELIADECTHADVRIGLVGDADI